MRHSLEKDRKYLRWNNRRGIAWITGRGYFWFKQRYLPAVRRVERANRKKDHFLLSDCYYQVGDVHDFNHCPLAAIAAYKRSFDLDPRHAEALREIGGMYERIGQYRKAVSVLKKSLKINPSDDYTQMDYEFALDSLKDGVPPLYKNGDTYWQARELLAREKPAPALQLLKNKRSIPARQIIACACGMLNDTDGIIEQWQRIANAAGRIEMGYADWFYIEDCVWDNVVFWEILADCTRQKRFNYGVWPTMDSLWKTVIPDPPSGRIPRKSEADRLRCNKRCFLTAQYHIARIKRDCHLAHKLGRRYPNWPEIGELLEQISPRAR
ncbi:MAG: tetratricopeptide repeat protein [Phycisphaerae bacterium]|nr:tetratricopeptide repeat protein [Phycisphaerae bacterium]